MTLRLVKDGEAEPDAEVVESIARATERMAAAVKDPDGAFWVMTAVGGDVAVAYYGGRLESAVLAEAVAGDMKREAVGL
jgi:hypothetical protein